MAGGNVAAAVCSASASSLLGVFISPLLVNLVMDVPSDGALLCTSITRLTSSGEINTPNRLDAEALQTLLGVFISPLLVNLVMDVHSNAPSDGLEQIGKIMHTPNRLDAEALQTAAATLPPAIEVKAMADCTVAGRWPGANR
jgi:hypothetical protein